jgi:hypothetical protein
VQGLLGAGVIASGIALAAAPTAGAVMTGPTTRDCSVLGIPGVFPGFDPDFVQIGNVVVGSGGALFAGSSVTMLASESSVPADQKQMVKFKVNVSNGTTSASFSGKGVGSVLLNIPLAVGRNTINWSATFDDGLHPCPNPLTATMHPDPFVVTSSGG